MNYNLYGVDDFGTRDFIKTSKDLDALWAIRDKKNHALDENAEDEFYRYFITYRNAEGEECLVK